MRADPDLAAMGGEIRRHRLAAKLSQEQLAEKAGLHRNYVGALERGESDLTGLTLFALGRALGVNPGVFFMPPTDTPAPATQRRRRPASGLPDSDPTTI